MADHGDPVPEADAELVEVGGLPLREVADLGVGEVAEGRRGLVGLVDDAHALAVHLDGAVDEVRDAEGDVHVGLLPRDVWLLAQ